LSGIGAAPSTVTISVPLAGSDRCNSDLSRCVDENAVHIL
jgi:hypothetical protein